MRNNNKKLTLKVLQEQLEQLKSKTTQAQPNQDIKHSYIQNLHMKSSMFMLWLATAVLSYGSKIPFIKQIIATLSIIYGRTTIWKVLVKIRKGFIMLNAVIGVYMVFKTVGFSYDNILAGFVGMGHSYLEIFTSFTKRLFHWFVELFDHKIIPNVPGDSSSGVSKNLWSNDPIDKIVHNPEYLKHSGRVEDSLRNSYKNLFNIQVEPTYTPWYKDLSTWLWLAGGVCLIYLGYKFIIDPLFVHDIGRDTSNVAGPSNIDPAPDITITDNRGITHGVSNFIEAINSRIFGRIRTGLNPFNWLVIGSDTGLNSQGFRNFMERQNHNVTAERSLYPFTANNPYAHWLDKLRINLFGESGFEALDRFQKMEYADRVANSLSVSKGKFRELVGASPAATPNIWVQAAAATNFATPVPSSSLVEAIQSYHIQHKLSLLPPTPTMNPGIADVTEWKTHVKETFTENTDNWLQNWKDGQPSTTTNVVDNSIDLD